MSRKIKFRNFSWDNITKFNANAIQEFDRYVPNAANAEYHAEYMLNLIHVLLNKHFPVLTSQISEERTMTSWINGKIINCIDKNIVGTSS